MADQSILSNQVSSLTAKWCNSRYIFSKLVYTWTIDGFRTKIMISDKLFVSTDFTEDETPKKMTWQLLVVPKLEDEKHILYFGICLKRTDEPNVEAMLDFSIFTPSGSKIFHKAVEKKTFTDSAKVVWISQDRDEMLTAMVPTIFDDRLTIRVEISILDTEIKQQSRVKVQELKLSQDYGQLLESESHSDLTLTVGSRSFRAHKVILSARSSVFAAMFQHDMLEKAENSVTITDIDPEVFAEILRFIYTGMVSSGAVLDTMALELLAAADKYALSELKEICGDSLKQTLSTETAVEILIMAELCNVPSLKVQALEFIKFHSAKVMLTSGWFKMQSYPEILKEF